MMQRLSVLLGGSRTARRMATTSASAAAPALTVPSMNEDLKKAQYAVRGELVLRAMAHADALKRGEKRPFKQLTFCNIGNPQELQQKPVTFFRQVLSLINWPELLSEDKASQLAGLFPADAVERARRYLRDVPGGLGAYTHSMGIEAVRQEVCAFISARDGGIPAHPSDIFLTDGASPAAQMFLKALIRDRHDGVMVPIPQYPLYSASIALYGGTMVNYYLNEQKGWCLERPELERSIAEARKRGVKVRAMVVINPGNPTGNVLQEDNLREIVDFAASHNLVLIADEVYQANVWDPSRRFVSMKQVAVQAGRVDPAATGTWRPGGLQLVSLHSTSKGFTGECGRRGGYFELCGFDEGVRSELYKLASISLCANSTGQVLMGLQSAPPQPGDASYALYVSERDAILASLQRRAVKLVESFRRLEGVTCEAPEGALYAFPNIRLPPKAVAAAAAAGKAPDTLYCLELLDATGVVVVPGSGFGQADGSFHLRSTILPPEADLDRVIAQLAAFHAAFMDKYR